MFCNQQTVFSAEKDVDVGWGAWTKPSKQADAGGSEKTAAQAGFSVDRRKSIGALSSFKDWSLEDAWFCLTFFYPMRM